MRGRGLADEEREEISRGIAAGESGRDVALRLGRHYSVINRCGAREGYRSAVAAALRVVRARRPKTHRLAVTGATFVARAWAQPSLSRR